MVDLDLRRATIRMPRAEYEQHLARAKAERRRAENEDQRPARPSGLDGGEGVRGDPRQILAHVFELLKDGNVEKAVEVLEAFLKTPTGPQPEEPVAKALLDLTVAAKAVANLRRGPDNLEAIARRIRDDKTLLRFIDAGVRQPSPARRLLRVIDRALQEDDR